MLKEFKCSELAEVVGGKASSGNIIVDNISSLDSAKCQFNFLFVRLILYFEVKGDKV